MISELVTGRLSDHLNPIPQSSWDNLSILSECEAFILPNEKKEEERQKDRKKKKKSNTSTGRKIKRRGENGKLYSEGILPLVFLVCHSTVSLN